MNTPLVEIVTITPENSSAIANMYERLSDNIRRLQRFQKRSKLQRTFDPFFSSGLSGYKSPKTLFYYYETLRTYNCHVGQLKLFYSLFEYLTLLQQKDAERLKRSLIVYAGAAIGTNIYVNSQLFPDTKWLLYDPEPFDKVLQRSPNIIIKRDYFGVDKSDLQTYTITKPMTDIHQACQRFGISTRDIIFISDLRTFPDEVNVMTDNHLCLKAVLDLKPWSYQIKFHTPYYQSPINTIENTHIKFYDKHTPLRNENLLSSRELSESQTNSLRTIKQYIPFKPDTYVYLKGTIYYQLFAPPHSAETRLVGFANRDGSYSLQRFNNEVYEKNLYRFNLSRNFFNYESASVSEIPCLSELIVYAKKYPYTRSFQPTYENVCELILIDRYHQQNMKEYKILSVNHKYQSIYETIHKVYSQMYNISLRRKYCKEKNYGLLLNHIQTKRQTT